MARSSDSLADLKCWAEEWPARLSDLKQEMGRLPRNERMEMFRQAQQLDQQGKMLQLQLGKARLSGDEQAQESLPALRALKE